MKCFTRNIVTISTFLFLCSCASISTLQTARTTDKGEFDHSIGFGSIKADVDTVSGIEIESDDAVESSISLPMVEYMGRYGITDSIDAGLRTTGFVHGLDVKWNFLNTGSFLISADIGINYLTYKISTTSSDTEVTAIDIVPAILIDVVLAEKARLYFVPKMVQRNVSVTGNPDESITYMGGSVGFRFGNSSGVFIEYTMINGSYTPSGSTTENDVGLSQLAGGFFF